MATKLMQGADAVAEAAINVGCRFFAGYPMLPFTAPARGHGQADAGRRRVSA